MYTKFIGFITATVFAVTGFGQTVDRTFHFRDIDTVQGMQEIATTVRAIADLTQTAIDTDQKLLTVHAAAGPIAVAEWLLDQLDNEKNWQPGQTPDSHKYLTTYGDPENVVRVFLLKPAATAENLQQVATLVRSITDMRRAFTYNAPRALVLRGTAGQISAAEWLVNELDTAANVPKAGERKYVMPAGRDTDNVMSVFYLSHADTIQNLQEAATVIRSIGEIRRLFTYSAPRAIAVRGTADQIGLVAWLVNELDQPANAAISTKREYTVPGSGDPDNVVRVFSLKHAGTPRRLQEVAVQVRTTTQVRRLFTYSAPRIITLRGTPVQIEQADQMIRERDQ